MDTAISLIEAVGVAGAAVVGLATLIHFKDKSIHNRISSVEYRAHDEINKRACKEDVKATLEPIRHEMIELRHRQDDILTALTRPKK